MSSTSSVKHHSETDITHIIQSYMLNKANGEMAIWSQKTRKPQTVPWRVHQQILIIANLLKLLTRGPSFLCPATKKWRGIMLYHLKFWVSVRPSVRPSVSAHTILLPATPPTVLGQSSSSFTGAFRMVWSYAYCFCRILKLFFITFFAFLT